MFYTQDPVDIFTEFAVRNPQYAVRVFLLIAVVLLFAFCLPSVLPEFDQSNRTILLFSQICDLKLMLKLLQIA